MIGLWLRRRARLRMRALRRAGQRVEHWQRRLLLRLVRSAADTPFGREHGFDAIRDVAGFAARVPLDDEPAERWPPSQDALWAYLARARDSHLLKGAVVTSGHGPAVKWPLATRDARALARTDVRVLVCDPFPALGLLDAVERETGRPLRATWPSWRGFVHAATGFAPYAETLRLRAGRSLACVETHPELAAVQDREELPGLALAPDRELFLEFVPESDRSRRLALHEVEKGEVYRVHATARGGLWARWTGRRVRFVRLRPPRIELVRSGVDAFGERLDEADVAEALERACRTHCCEAAGATVLPEYPDARDRHGRHLWIVELAPPPRDLARFAAALDRALKSLRPRYAELRAGALLPPRVRLVRRGVFASFARRAGGAGRVPCCITADEARHLLPG